MLLGVVLLLTASIAACSKAASEDPATPSATKPDASIEGARPPPAYGERTDDRDASAPAETSCLLAGDCPVRDKCQIATCVGRVCQYRERECQGACTDVCDPATGLCKASSEGELCDGGECAAGACRPLPECSKNKTPRGIYCGTTLSWSLEDENVLSRYACASGEDGAETRFKFYEAGSGTREVTFSITPEGSGTVPDYDIIVVEGSNTVFAVGCNRTSPCLNPANGSDVAGITSATAETLTLTLKKGIYYDVVVDTKTLLPGDFSISVTCP